MNVYAARDYRDFLNQKTKDEKGRGGLSRIASAAKCQNSHITRVLKGEQHITMDQAFRLARFWHLPPDEERFFLKLVEWDRSGEPAFRAQLRQELDALKKEQEDFSVRLQKDAVPSTSFEMLYYSAWYWSAIHVITSVPEFRTVGAISSRLQLPLPVVRECLEMLEAHGLVERRDAQWQMTGKNIHLPKQSPLNSVQHGNWRSRAVFSSQIPGDDGVHFTTVQSVSKADFESIKQILFESIDRYAAVANPSREEELVCFLCDFFRVA